MDVKRIDQTLPDKAFQDVRASRRNHWPHAIVWVLSLQWNNKKQEILHQLNCGQYRFSPCHSYFKDGDWRSYWKATDAVVLKAMSYLLQEKINITDCHHLKGHGGINGSLKALRTSKPHYQKAFKSDIDSYYASIDHNILLSQLKNFSDCKILHDLFKQYLKRVEIRNGNYHTFEMGIPMGC